MTTIIKDLRENSEFAARQWKRYQAATRRIGDTDSLREANEGLGYNLVKTIPGLLQWIQELQDDNDALRMDISTRQTKPSEPEKLATDRPLGIPADHIVPNVSDSVDLEVVTEEAPGAGVVVHMRRGAVHEGAGEDCSICWPDGSEANEPNPTPGQMPRSDLRGAPNDSFGVFYTG